MRHLPYLIAHAILGHHCVCKTGGFSNVVSSPLSDFIRTKDDFLVNFSELVSYSVPSAALPPMLTMITLKQWNMCGAYLPNQTAAGDEFPVVCHFLEDSQSEQLVSDEKDVPTTPSDSPRGTIVALWRGYNGVLYSDTKACPPS